MKPTTYASMIGTLVAISVSACAAERVAPKALVDARADYTRVSNGVAMQLDPTDVHEADLALQRAEKAWLDSPNDPSTVDLALIADRRALLAKSEADALSAQRDAQNANATLQASRSAQLRNAQSQLQQTQQALGRTQDQLQQSQADAVAQQNRMIQLEA